MNRRNLFLSALTLVLATGALAAGSIVMEGAAANPCADQCRAQHNQCRISTKGSPSCDAALTSCLQSCQARR